MPGDAVAVGVALGSGKAYCDLYLVMGPGETGLVSKLVGTIQPPEGGVEIPIEAENTVATSARPPLLDGIWVDDVEVGDAVVTLTRTPARALDGLVLEDLSGLDLAYEFAWAVGQGTEVTWEMVR